MSGPFALVRNPLYLGNIALWVGFALIARLVWMAPVIAIALALEYHAIVRWEEQLLDQRLGDRISRLPASVPLDSASQPDAPGARRLRLIDGASTLFSERGTLIAIAAGYALLWGEGAV